MSRLRVSERGRGNETQAGGGRPNESFGKILCCFHQCNSVVQHATPDSFAIQSDTSGVLAAPLTVCRRLRTPAGCSWRCSERGVLGMFVGACNSAQRMQYCCAASNSPSVCNRMQQISNILRERQRD